MQHAPSMTIKTNESRLDTSVDRKTLDLNN